MTNNMLSSTEVVVGKIWTELLHIDKVGSQDNFFELGGDSLMALTMLFRVSDAVGVEVRIETLMDTPELGEFCRIIDGKKSELYKTDTGGIIPRAVKGNLSVSFIPILLRRRNWACLLCCACSVSYTYC